MSENKERFHHWHKENSGREWLSREDYAQSAWNHQDKKISQLEKENAELQKGMIDAGEVIKRRKREVADKDKLIAELKEELAKERKCVEYYGNYENHIDGDDYNSVIHEEDEEFIKICGQIVGGKRARQRIIERKEFKSE